MENFIARRQDKDADEMLQYSTIGARERIASCSKWLSAVLVMTLNLKNKGRNERYKELKQLVDDILAGSDYFFYCKSPC